MREATYYKNSGDKSLCLLCPHHCVLAEGQQGLCRSRSRSQGRLWAANYGQVTSVALDPIEKKPLNRFHPGSTILTLGGRGCNLTCAFCQNYHISQEEAEFSSYSPEAVSDLALRLTKEGNIGLAFSYNEPLISYEYIRDVAALIRQAGLKNILVSNGYLNEAPLKELLPLIDAMNIDLKAFNDDFYRTWCRGSLHPVLRNIELAAAQCRLEVTTLVIPGLNDDPAEIRASARWLAGIDPNIPLHLSRFFPRYKMVDREPPSYETMTLLGEIAGEYLNYVYLGNM